MTGPGQSRIIWQPGDHGWLTSRQGWFTLYVAEESSGWVFWAARQGSGRRSYLALVTGLPSRQAATDAAENWAIENKT